MTPDREPITLGEISRAVTRIEGDNRAIRERNHSLESTITALAIEQGRQGEKLDGLQEDVSRIESAQITGRNLIFTVMAGLVVTIIMNALVLVTRG